MFEYYTIKEVSELLKVSKMTIYRYIKKGVLNAVRLEQEFRISKEELNRYLKSKQTNKEENK